MIAVVCLQKVQDLATALLVSDPHSFQVACHTLLGAVTILHETCGHAFRTRHFSTTEFRSPPAYRSVNDATTRFSGRMVLQVVVILDSGLKIQV